MRCSVSSRVSTARPATSASTRSVPARAGEAVDLGGLAAHVVKAADVPGVRAITVDSRVYRDAGGSAVDEDRLCRGHRRRLPSRPWADGVAPSDAFGHRVSCLRQPPISSSRRLRCGLYAGCGPRGRAVGAWPDRGDAHAVTALLRMFTRDDPWVNVLRATLATFGASVGGADSITVLPYDTVAGLPEKFSRHGPQHPDRPRRRGQCRAGHRPAGGSWYVEALTDELAAAAWATFQEIEAAGGMPQALADGIVAARIAATHDEEAIRIANRREPITGVSMFPSPGRLG